MINVNLLPISTFKQKLKGRIFLTALSLLLVIGCAGIFSVKTFILDENTAKLKAQASQLRTELQTVTNNVATAQKQTEATVRNWKQLTALMDLEERRRDQTRLLAEVEQLVPKDNAWLTAMDHKKGVLTINGISKDKDTISQFLNRLQNASYLDRSSVFLGEISQNMRINNIVLTSFTIRAQTKFPRPTIMDEGMPEYNLPSSSQFVELVTSADQNLGTGLGAATAAQRR